MNVVAAPVRIEFVLEARGPRRYRLVVQSIGDVRFARLVPIAA